MIKTLISQLAWKNLPFVLTWLILLSLIQLIQTQFPLFEFHVSNIQLAEFWRIVTGHFVHSNIHHLLMNSAALLALWSLHGHYYQARSISILIILSCLFISAFLTIFSEIDIYFGFSGVLHALVCWGALKDIGQREQTGYLLLAALICKLFYEQFFGASQSTEELIGVAVATKAHLAGALFGLFYYCGQKACKRGHKNLNS